MITWDSEPEHSDDDTVWARSEGDVVEVGVSPQGRLRHVQIADDWRSHLKPSELAQNLVALAVGAHAQSVRENPPAGDQAPTAGTETSVSFELFEQVQREQAHYLATYDERLRAELTFSNPEETVTVTARGGSPSSVEFEDFWISVSPGAEVARTVFPLLDAALRSGEDIDEHMREEFPAITKYRRIRAATRAARGW